VPVSPFFSYICSGALEIADDTGSLINTVFSTTEIRSKIESLDE